MNTLARLVAASNLEPALVLSIPVTHISAVSQARAAQASSASGPPSAGLAARLRRRRQARFCRAWPPRAETAQHAQVRAACPSQTQVADQPLCRPVRTAPDPTHVCVANTEPAARA